LIQCVVVKLPPYVTCKCLQNYTYKK